MMMTLYPLERKAPDFIIGEKIEQVVFSALSKDLGMIDEEVLNLILSKIKETSNHSLGYI